jgi:hypothetical protein
MVAVTVRAGAPYGRIARIAAIRAERMDATSKAGRSADTTVVIAKAAVITVRKICCGAMTIWAGCAWIRGR